MLAAARKALRCSCTVGRSEAQNNRGAFSGGDQKGRGRNGDPLAVVVAATKAEVRLAATAAPKSQRLQTHRRCICLPLRDP